MNTIEVPGQKHIIQIPSDWEELHPDQVKKILQYAVLFTTGQMDYCKFIEVCFYIIADIKRNWKSVFKEKLLSERRKEEKWTNTYIKAQELTIFLFKPVRKKDKQKPAEFYYNTVKNFLPTFEAQNVTYYGPEDFLGDITFGEFIDAVESMHEYFSSKEEQDLDRFIVSLYRPSADNRKRMARNEDLVDDHARRLKKVPAYIKLGILLWFSTCVKYIKSEDIIISGKELNLSVLFPEADEPNKKEKKKSSGLGWTSVLYGVAKEGLFGPIEQTYSTNLFKVLMFMYDSYLTNLKLKQKNK